MRHRVVSDIHVSGQTRSTSVSCEVSTHSWSLRSAYTAEGRECPCAAHILLWLSGSFGPLRNGTSASDQVRENVLATTMCVETSACAGSFAGALRLSGQFSGRAKGRRVWKGMGRCAQREVGTAAAQAGPVKAF